MANERYQPAERGGVASLRGSKALHQYRRIWLPDTCGLRRSNGKLEPRAIDRFLEMNVVDHFRSIRMEGQRQTSDQHRGQRGGLVCLQD